MRTTVTLDDDVFEAARALAAGSGQTLGQVLSRLARQGLRGSAERTSRRGLAVFPVPADSPVIPSDRARELLANDE
jgi:hypothetical protein